MDEGRKRVLGIIAGILVARHLRTTEDLFDNRPSPRPSPWLRPRFSGRSASCGRWTTSLPASDHTTGPFSRMHISATVSLLAPGESPELSFRRVAYEGLCATPLAWDQSWLGC